MNPYIEIFLRSKGDICDTAVCVRYILGNGLRFNRRSKTWILSGVECKPIDIVNKIKNEVCNVIIQDITMQKNGLSKREFEEHAKYFEERLNVAFKFHNRDFVDKVVNMLKRLCE